MPFKKTMTLIIVASFHVRDVITRPNLRSNDVILSSILMFLKISTPSGKILVCSKGFGVNFADHVSNK